MVEMHNHVQLKMVLLPLHPEIQYAKQAADIDCSIFHVCRSAGGKIPVLLNQPGLPPGLMMMVRGVARDPQCTPAAEVSDKPWIGGQDKNWTLCRLKQNLRCILIFDVALTMTCCCTTRCLQTSLHYALTQPSRMALLLAAEIFHLRMFDNKAK